MIRNRRDTKQLFKKNINFSFSHYVEKDINVKSLQKPKAKSNQNHSIIQIKMKYKIL
jgi:hypothetical protein